MSWFKFIIIRFFNSLYSMFSEFCGAANIRLHILVKMENKMKKSLSPMYSLKLKNIILFLTQTLIFILFKWSYSKRCFNVSKRVKRYIENGKIISTLPNFVQIKCWFDVVQGWRTERCFNVYLTLCHVVTSCQSKTTLKRLEIVCWVTCLLKLQNGLPKVFYFPLLQKQVLEDTVKYSCS